MSDPTQVVVCAPMGWDHTADSIQVAADCGHDVWIAPAGQRLLAEGAVARCVPCVIPALKENPDIRVEPAPGVLADVERDQGSWQRARAEAFMKAIGMHPNG